MKGRWKTYGFWIALAEGVGALAAWLTRKGVEWFNLMVRKPALTPPEWVFPVAWGILYALMGIGAARVRLADPTQTSRRAINLFLVQLAMNFCWSILFFNFRAYGAALLWLAVLWAVIAAMALEFAKAAKAAGWLQAPYLVWVAFALYLNYGVWRLNG